MMLPHQATAVAIGTRALLIEGPPGAGKSSLALALIDRGARLIGDDSLMLAIAGGRLLAHPHPATHGLLEVRGLGLLRFEVCDGAPASLVLRLDEAAPRHVEQAEDVDLAGVPVPMLRLQPGGPILHLKAELALQRYGL